MQWNDEFCRWNSSCWGSWDQKKKKRDLLPRLGSSDKWRAETTNNSGVGSGGVLVVPVFMRDAGPSDAAVRQLRGSTRVSQLWDFEATGDLFPAGAPLSFGRFNAGPFCRLTLILTLAYPRCYLLVRIIWKDSWGNFFFFHFCLTVWSTQLTGLQTLVCSCPFIRLKKCSASARYGHFVFISTGIFPFWILSGWLLACQESINDGKDALKESHEIWIAINPRRVYFVMFSKGLPSIF